MNRKLAGMLAAFAGLAVSATALAGGLDAMTIVQPVSGDDEFAGLDTIVTFDLAAGLNGTGQLITGEALDVSLAIPPGARGQLAAPPGWYLLDDGARELLGSGSHRFRLIR